MADREDIVELINLYGFAMDTQRWDLFDRIFTEDVDADYGPTSHWTNRAQFKSDFGSFHELFDATQHVMTNHLVKVDGDRAASHTYGAWRLIRHAAGDPRVQTPMEEIEFKLDLVSMRQEGAEGRLNFLKAIT